MWGIRLGAGMAWSIGQRAEGILEFGLGAGMERWDVIFLIGRGCGMVVVFLSSSARELCLVPNKHSSSIFTLRFSHAKIISR